MTLFKSHPEVKHEIQVGGLDITLAHYDRSYGALQIRVGREDEAGLKKIRETINLEQASIDELITSLFLLKKELNEYEGETYP